MALELIRHGDGRLDAERLTRFVLAFQTVAPLTIGELWAWPSMLKLALLENLRLLTDGILAGPGGAPRRRTSAFARPGARRASRAASRRRSTSAFVAQLRQRMREHDPRVSPLAAAVEQALAALGTTPEDVVRSENQRQATDQVSTGNTVTSLRLCATLDWSRFVEQVSPVEQILRRDPAAVYPRMDFASRDRYRHAVEELAEPTGEAQVRVALRAVESARQAAEQDGIGETGRARRLSPDRPGPARPRDRRGLPPAPRRAASPPRLRPRDRGLPRRHRPPDRRSASSPRTPTCGRCGRRRAGDRRGAARAAPGERARRARSCSASSPRSSRRAGCPARVRRRGPRERPHDGGRAHAPRQRGRASSGSSSTSRCRRSGTSIPTSTSRC